MTYDFVVVGGGSAAVAAALELRDAGYSGLVASHRSYLGEDICDSLRLQMPTDLDTSDPLTARLYGSDGAATESVRPMQVKSALDGVLAEADIPVMLSSYVHALWCDAEGQLAGVELSSGGTRLRIACRILIDGSLRGEVMRMAGVPLTPPLPEISVERSVLGGKAAVGSEAQWQARGTVAMEGADGPVVETLWVHHSTAALADGSWAAWMALEQQTRLHAHRIGQRYSADSIFALSGERLQPGQAPVNAAGDLAKVPVSAVSAMAERLWATGAVANVDVVTLERLLRPDGAIAWGRQLGKAIGMQLQAYVEQAAPVRVHVGAMPELEYEVLVVGGGTGGAPAGIGAARHGARTLVAETLSGLGGVGTLGMIGRYWFGNRVGFTAEIDAAVAQLTDPPVENGWDVEAKMHWYHHALSHEGGSIWYKTALAAVLTDAGRVVGAVLSTPQGPVRVRARCTVDATGAAAVPALAGAECVGIGDGHLALQGTGLPLRQPGLNYGNTDYDFIDESDSADAASAFITARQKFKRAFDAGQLIDSRERRRVVGAYEITPMDIRLGRVYPDTVVKARSNFDTHGYTIHPLFEVVPPGHEPIEAYIPLRALLPKQLDGVLVTGLGISAHRDAMPVIRMQADVQNQGYVAGLIAALSEDGRPRGIDIAALQQRLVAAGILDAAVCGAADSFPLPESEISAALAASVDNPEYIDRVFTLADGERDQRLREALQAADTPQARLHFALVLGILGQADGAAILASHLAATPWDHGWNYTGMGQFGTSMSPLDRVIVALGRCRRPEDVALLAAKAAVLPEPTEFSHYKALAEALQTIGVAEGIPVLEKLLQRPCITGHAITSTQARLAAATEDWEQTGPRNAALIELHLAAALHALAPTHPVAREVLESYAHDLRKLFAQFARTRLRRMDA